MGLEVWNGVGGGGSCRSGMCGLRFSVAEARINGGERTIDVKRGPKRTLDYNFLMLCVIRTVAYVETLIYTLIQHEELAMMGKECKNRNRKEGLGIGQNSWGVARVPPHFSWLVPMTVFSLPRLGNFPCCSPYRWGFQHETSLCLDDRLYFSRAVCSIVLLGSPGSSPAYISMSRSWSMLLAI